MANFAAKFSKDSRAAMQPITTTHYIEGNRLRTDGLDGSIQIIDLDGRRIISIDNQKKTYSVATFEEIKVAMEKARRDAEAKMQQENTGKPAAQAQDAQLQSDSENHLRPARQRHSRHPRATHERNESQNGYMEMQAQGTTDASAAAVDARSAQQRDFHHDHGHLCRSQRRTAAGYQEIGEFYKKMAKEVNWVPPSNIHVRSTHDAGNERTAEKIPLR